MAARLPPELAGELYCRANVEPMQYATMNPQTATELLDRAWLLYTQSQLSFGYNYIDKPPGKTKEQINQHIESCFWLESDVGSNNWKKEIMTADTFSNLNC